MKLKFMSVSLGRWVVHFALSGILTGCAVNHRFESVPGNEPTDVTATLFLVGDAGEVNALSRVVLLDLERAINATIKTGQQVAVAFLGDNIYPKGMRIQDGVLDVNDVLRLQYQVDAVTTVVDTTRIEAYFVPGNHDWGKGAALVDARHARNLQRDYVVGLGLSWVHFVPKQECGEPMVYDLGQSAKLVFLDTEWLLRSPKTEHCSKEKVLAGLRKAIGESGDTPTIVMAHHPLESGGPHGGNGWLGQLGVTRQDLTSPQYTSVRRAIRSAFVSRNGLRVFAAGHDHNLQVIMLSQAPGPHFQLVSGSAAKSSAVRALDGTRYATNSRGYMRLDFTDQAVYLSVVALSATTRSMQAIFRCQLWTAGGVGQCKQATRLEPN